MRVVRSRSRLVAATAAVTLGLGVAGVLAAGPAAAASVDVKCALNGFSTIVPWTWNPSVSFSPSSPEVGDSVKVTLTLPEGYKNGPAVPVKDSQLAIIGTLSIGGTTVQTKGKPEPGTYPPNQLIKIAPLTGTYSASKAGDQKVTLTKVYFDHLPSKIDTTCTPQSKPTVATLTVTAPASSGGNNNTANANTNTNANTNSNSSGGANTSSNGGSNKSGNKSGGKEDLAHTGAGDAWITAAVAAIALQLGLVAYVRARRRPVTIRRAI